MPGPMVEAGLTDLRGIESEVGWAAAWARQLTRRSPGHCDDYGTYPIHQNVTRADPPER
jgi:hypothetical protein